MNDLIDTTEMYLRTIFELEEEGVTPLRARIAERLHQSGPTVSQTVARMERDGLLSVEGDRHLELSDTGRKLATQVMRKHRLAERLLVDVIGMDWEEVHIEACRWEHVMSEAVERRLVALLDNPTTCPHGNPIPGLDGLGWTGQASMDPGINGLLLLSDTATDAGHSVRVERISEQIQPDADLMHMLTDAHVRPGNTVLVTRRPDGVDVNGHRLPRFAAEHIFVSLPVEPSHP
ncbi:MAG: metal-dependent transcriptional regulator [Geodermatophilaceae bacterium]|nr:metal-dependent transcriptional regulator [Geodermatophilaceae bacterium]